MIKRSVPQNCAKKSITHSTLILLISISLGINLFSLKNVHAESVISTDSDYQMMNKLNYEENVPSLPAIVNLPPFTNGNPSPGVFNKFAPASGSTGVSLSPVLSWNVSTNATKYEYCYDTTNDGTCSNWISTGANTYVGLWALQQNTTYYWQVRSWNGTYGPTYANNSAGAYWYFKTVLIFPGAFNKHAPASGTTGVSLSPVLSWNVSTNATKYEYCYDTTNDGTCGNWISTGTNTYVGLRALQQNTTYYWQVRSWNGTFGPTYANGSAGAYWSFKTVLMLPGAFNKFAPANGSTGVSPNPVLSWNASANATRYEYCFDTTNDGTCGNWISTGTNTYVGLRALQQNTTYYWQVRSWNGTFGPTYANGSAGAYWSFKTVLLLPGAFNKHAPANGSTGVSLNPALSWNASANATRYEYCFDTTNDNACSNWISTGANTYAGLSGLNLGTNYYWQVRSWNGTYGPTYANGSASDHWSFIVKWLDTSNRQISLEYYMQVYRASGSGNSEWTGNHSSCDAGETAQAFRDAVELRINYFRAMAGVPASVELSDVFNSKAQEAALMMSVNGRLSHSPTEDWRCYTPEGDEAAGNSDLFLGVYGSNAITGYIHDWGGNNYPVGHRRWILYPQTKSMGTGDIPPTDNYSSANALWVFDDNMWTPRPRTRDTFVAWPPPGYVPYQLIYPRWSFSYDDADFSTTTVVMSSNGSNIPLSIKPVVYGYGENTLVWEPNVSSGTRPTEDTNYNITISNVKIGNVFHTFSYQVIIFDPSAQTMFIDEEMVEPFGDPPLMPDPFSIKTGW